VEIEDFARRIGTYNISAKTVDGCTVVPDKPATRSRPEEVANLEEALGLPGLCSEAAERIERRI